MISIVMRARILPLRLLVAIVLFVNEYNHSAVGEVARRCELWLNSSSGDLAGNRKVNTTYPEV